MPAILAALLLLGCTPQTMLRLHRHENPDGPYRREVCASPTETGTRWACAPDKVRQLRREAAVMRAWARRYLTSSSCAPGNPSGCAAMIRRVFTSRGLDGEAAVRVAQCESGLNPAARNPSSSASGLFQQLATYWEGRAAAYGVAGRSVFDGEANAIVSAGMVAGSGWSAWVCQP